MVYLLLLIGLAVLVVGAELLVRGAVTLAEVARISPLVIGLTVVAFGTSAPELAVSTVSSLKGDSAIALGNVVGSNIFNLLSVLGLSSIVSPSGILVPAVAIGFDIPVMIGVALMCLPIFFSGYVITRWNGALFLFYYIAYTAYLIMAAAEHDAMQDFRMAMLVVMPLTGIALMISAYRYHRLKS